LKRLNLGTGNRLIGGPGAVNHDLIKHRPEIDVTHDLNVLPWPWPDEEFEGVVAWAVLEHLEINLLTAMDEIWRITKPGGELTVKVPYWNHEDAYNDPTHRYVYGKGVFDVFDPDTRRGKEYDFYTDRKWRIQQVNLTKSRTCIAAQLFKIGHEKLGEAQ
jgi:predicted SAM-dependent methyltransferase